MYSVLNVVLLLLPLLQGTYSYECRNCCGIDISPFASNVFKDSEGAKLTSCMGLQACKGKEKVKCGYSASHCYVREGIFTRSGGGSYSIYLELCYREGKVSGAGTMTGLTCDGSDSTDISGSLPIGYYKLTPTLFAGNPAFSSTPYTRCDKLTGLTAATPSTAGGAEIMALPGVTSFMMIATLVFL